MKPARCKVCKGEYQRLRPLQRVCGLACAVSDGQAKASKARAQEAKAERRQDADARMSIKPRSQWLKDAQTAFNAWVRVRDDSLPCISCGRRHTGQYHAGHYLSTGARPELRFEPYNVHKQCSACNMHLHGNLVLYRLALSARIGADRLAWLEGPHEPKHYSVDDLKAIKAKYSKMAREIKRDLA